MDFKDNKLLKVIKLYIHLVSFSRIINFQRTLTLAALKNLTALHS